MSFITTYYGLPLKCFSVCVFNVVFISSLSLGDPLSPLSGAVLWFGCS